MNSNSTLRSEIESMIRRDAYNDREYIQHHERYYDIFFDIFSSLRRDYENNYKHLKKIEYIEKKNLLKIYKDIVAGRGREVRARYYRFLEEETKKQIRKGLGEETIERIIKRTTDYNQKLSKGANTPLEDCFAKNIVDEEIKTYEWNCSTNKVKPSKSVLQKADSYRI
ncbi:hypothetical protein [Paenibacillus sp. FSL R10-2748]|uniref:hypothetical protein n=1 Tax=Paenibacillus sp. FSL R10-2748 TaxID=2954658 RepID=UPI0030FB121B